MQDLALSHLRRMFGETAAFRGGQWEAIRLALSGRRALIVQQTGWGKSVVYFIAAKLIREKGGGPALLISPLLSLMRNQIDSASRLGILARSVNSQNAGEWEAVKEDLRRDDSDVLMISPEQLANHERFKELMDCMPKGIGLFVVGEAHCISDWGHDFRPDYRRIARIVRALPPNVPVLATTATANGRVCEDVASQLGDVQVLRGPPGRGGSGSSFPRFRTRASPPRPPGTRGIPKGSRRSSAGSRRRYYTTPGSFLC